jgi:hypothetical protein
LDLEKVENWNGNGNGKGEQKRDWRGKGGRSLEKDFIGRGLDLLGMALGLLVILERCLMGVRKILEGSF